MGVFNSMLANVYGRLSAAFGDHGAFKYTVNVFYVASLCSAQVYFFVFSFTQLTLCHEPASHAADSACSVSRPINENSSKGGEGITIK